MKWLVCDEREIQNREEHSLKYNYMPNLHRKWQVDIHCRMMGIIMKAGWDCATMLVAV